MCVSANEIKSVLIYIINYDMILAFANQEKMGIYNSKINKHNYIRKHTHTYFTYISKYTQTYKSKHTKI